MYFPYVRGRQYELLALRELTENNLLGSYIIPIIEPVKLSSTLITTISEFISKAQKIALIQNPIVGSFMKDFEYTKTDSKEKSIRDIFLESCQNDLVIKSVIMHKNDLALFDEWENSKANLKDLLVIINNRDSLDLFEKYFDKTSPCYTLMPDESTFRRRIKENRVTLNDRFEKQDRNVDYQNAEDEFFSDDHLFYKHDALIGFSDYTIVGNEFQETGFAPYAVAIHIVYFAPDKSLRVRHFVSDSNEDISNPAKKFYEALSKLNSWYENQKEEDKEYQRTLGLSTLLNHYKQETYPGLGSIKKLSIMHHLELMGKHLSEDI